MSFDGAPVKQKRAEPLKVGCDAIRIAIRFEKVDHLYQIIFG